MRAESITKSDVSVASKLHVSQICAATTSIAHEIRTKAIEIIEA